MTPFRLFNVVIACLLLTTAAYGQRRGEIKEGSNAPGLDVEAWYNSEGVTIEEGKAYLVVFFEEGNLLSDVLMAVLDDAHEELSETGLVIIGITPDDDEFVTGWIRRNGDQIQYAIGRDRRIPGSSRADVLARRRVGRAARSPARASKPPGSGVLPDRRPGRLAGSGLAGRRRTA